MRMLQRKAKRDAQAGADRAVEKAAGSTGQPLPAGLQKKFEGQLGADLSGVRVHTGGASAEANEAVGARAYTTGNDIHFNSGEYDPSSKAGQELIAHEVVHTVQQKSGGTQLQRQRKDGADTSDDQEKEADETAADMTGKAKSHQPHGEVTMGDPSVEPWQETGPSGLTQVDTPTGKLVYPYSTSERDYYSTQGAKYMNEETAELLEQQPRVDRRVVDLAHRKDDVLGGSPLDDDLDQQMAKSIDTADEEATNLHFEVEQVQDVGNVLTDVQKQFDHAMKAIGSAQKALEEAGLKKAVKKLDAGIAKGKEILDSWDGMEKFALAFASGHVEMAADKLFDAILDSVDEMIDDLATKDLRELRDQDEAAAEELDEEVLMETLGLAMQEVGDSQTQTQRLITQANERFSALKKLQSSAERAYDNDAEGGGGFSFEKLKEKQKAVDDFSMDCGITHTLLNVLDRQALKIQDHVQLERSQFKMGEPEFDQELVTLAGLQARVEGEKQLTQKWRDAADQARLQLDKQQETADKALIGAALDHVPEKKHHKKPQTKGRTGKRQ